MGPPEIDAPISVTRLNVPLVIGVIALATLLGAWGSAAVAHAQLDATVQDVAEIKGRVPSEAAWRQHVDDRLDVIDNAIERVEKKLK
jgi:hypothetical protein